MGSNPIRPPFMYNIIKRDNFFYCDICDEVSYDFECECGATLCNGAGCEKCTPLFDILRQYYNEGLFPTKEEALKLNIEKFGEEQTPETKLLTSIFSTTQ